MLTYVKVAQKPRMLRALTGLRPEGFGALLKAFATTTDAAQQAAEAQRRLVRQRARGGGRKPKLETLADKLLFILFYFRVYPTQVALGFFFGLSQAQANEWIGRLTPHVEAALDAKQHLPARQAADVRQVLSACPGLEFIVDGSERPIRRPQDAARQKKFYSGKKKRHTVKNIVIIDKRTKQIKVLSPTSAGKKHDKALVDEQAYVFPKGAKLWQDTGFQGYTPAHTTISQPTKKPKGRELTAQQKADNHYISQQRIGVEHALGSVKVFRIVSDVFRNFRDGFADTVMLITCGLHNLRLDHPGIA
jgi:hypothetical protein